MEPLQDTKTVFLSHLTLYPGSAKDQKKKEKSVHISALEAQVTDVCTVHQTGFIVGINCVRTRQEISKHISIVYNMLYWTMRIFAV